MHDSTSRFEAVRRAAAAVAPPRVAAGLGDHVAFGDTYVGAVVDILPCGTFVCALRDPATRRVHDAPFYATERLRIVAPRR